METNFVSKYLKFTTLFISSEWFPFSSQFSFLPPPHLSIPTPFNSTSIHHHYFFNLLSIPSHHIWHSMPIHLYGTSPNNLSICYPHSYPTILQLNSIPTLHSMECPYHSTLLSSTVFPLWFLNFAPPTFCPSAGGPPRVWRACGAAWLPRRGWRWGAAMSSAGWCGRCRRCARECPRVPPNLQQCSKL